MAVMCPIDGCKKKKGLCIHDWMMLGMVALMMTAATLRYGFGVW
jgi:hypothetical protein